jgi:CIC family chloride channel protein
MLLKTMLILCAVKLVATMISYASGNAGGIFAPSLYLGAMAGGAVGMVVHQVAPFPTGAPGAYALVGMGTLFAGIIRAPMTSVFMIFELTQDYKILVPLMTANMLSFVISKRFQPKPVYTALLEQSQVYLPEADERRPKNMWRARDVMTRDVKFLSEQLSIKQAWNAVQDTKVSTFLVGSSNRLAGAISRKAIEQALQSGHGEAPIVTIATRELTLLREDDSLESSLERFDTHTGLVPVFSRNDPQQLEGVITVDSILKFIHKKSA